MQQDPIWAPWRLGYILGEEEEERPEVGEPPELMPDADPDCFLCQAAAAGVDLHRQVIWRSEQTVTVLNRYPYNNGHLLVAPTRHLARPDQLDDELQLALSKSVTKMVGLLEKLLRPEGFNVGLNLGRAAGAGLPGHLHWHIVPRWNGDTNFMPSVAGIKVIPQSLDSLWKALTDELALD